MAITLAALLVGALHVGYTFACYGTGMFGFPLSWPVGMTVWLLLPSALAACFHWRISGRILRISARPVIRTTFVLAWVSTSVYIGVFLALNRFGS